MWPFRKKPGWTEEYAQRLYDGLIAHNEFGNINAITLHIPTAMHGAYQNKILTQREMLCLAALGATLEQGPALKPVAQEFMSLIMAKMSARGLQLSQDQLANIACDDLERLSADPLRWGRDWLAEFRSDPTDATMAALFGEHCLRLFKSYKNAIIQTRPANKLA